MVFETIAPGIQLVGQFGHLKTGIWLFNHKTQCMVLEMPDLSESDSFQKPWKEIGDHLTQENLELKLTTATHVHGDHFNTYLQFHLQFLDVPIIVNSFFFQNKPISNFITPENLEKKQKITESIIYNGVPIYCFKDKCFKTNLDDEPLYLIHAPKHSWSDTMIIFRGCMITGDWWLGPGDPNSNRIPISTIHESINFLEAFCKDNNYQIHSLFSVHANEFRHSINFYELMEETRPQKK